MRRPLVARSPEESQLYIELHPCSCGAARLHRLAHQLVPGRGAPLSIYAGLCAGCGRQRQFEFELHPGQPPRPPSFGGAQPSTIIDPGQFLAVARRAAGDVPPDPTGLSAAERTMIRRRAARAVAALAEVLKFVEDDVVPVAALTSTASRLMHARNPGQFWRHRLEAELERYRAVAARYTPPAGR